MRLAIKLLLPLAVIIVAAVGFLPPVLSQGSLDTDAVNAAKAGASALSTSGQAAAEAAVRSSVAGDPGVTLVSVRLDPNGLTQDVQVTLSEKVNSFLNGISGLKSWFHDTSTQDSQLGA